MSTESFRYALGIAGTSIALYAIAWSISVRHTDRRWWIYLLVSAASWLYTLWIMLH